MKLFENTEIAFKLKSKSELKRAYFLFKIMQNHSIVKIGTLLTNFALKIHLPVQKLIRYTVFDHFCGGITEKDSIPMIDKMYYKGRVHSVLDYSVEGKQEESSFDNALKKIIEIIEFSKEKESIPFAVFKPTAFGRFALYQKITEKKLLTSQEKLEWNKVKDRFNKVANIAYKNDVPVLIDAEESWMQDAADELIEELMIKFNKNKAIIFNTLQMYRHDRLEYLQKLHDLAQQKGFYVGVKIVRGAYMEKERERADVNNYKSPICVDKPTTDKNYNNAIKYIMKHNNIELFAGTHNEESSYLLMNLIKEHKKDKKNKSIWFGQLLGMSDNISFNLAKEGFNVAKYVPFGPVREVMPYLIRRAHENKSIEGQTNRELNLIKTEKNRRKLK